MGICCGQDSSLQDRLDQIRSNDGLNCPSGKGRDS